MGTNPITGNAPVRDQSPLTSGIGPFSGSRTLLLADARLRSEGLGSGVRPVYSRDASPTSRKAAGVNYTSAAA